MNQSAFDKRVKNWKETLFTNVPRADPDDPAYDNIRAKAFSSADAPAAPKTVIFTPGVPISTPVRVPLAQPAAFTRKEDLTPEVAVPVIEETTSVEQGPLPPQVATVVTPRVAPPGNTPFEQGMILGGGPAKPEIPKEPESLQSNSGPGKTFILEDD